MSAAHEPKNSILHLCGLEILRPVRDQILHLSGFVVCSTGESSEALALFHTQPFDLVLIDIEGEESLADAERLCSEIKTVHHGQLVAFACNWRVAILSDCPDEILRSEFDPAAFVAGVKKTLVTHHGSL